MNLKEELKSKEEELVKMKEKAEMHEKISKAKDMELEELKKRVADYVIETPKVNAFENEIPKLSKGIAVSIKF